MHLPLPLHLSIHFALAVLAGYIVGRRFKAVWLGIIAGIMGGFFIDLDHVLEYFFVFGPHFNLLYFSQGRQFLSSEKMHVIFHAWEYAPILLAAAWALRRRYRKAAIFILALTCGALVHLVTDCVVNAYPPQVYSIVYRASQNFEAQKLVSPEQWQDYITQRHDLGM